MKTSHIFVTRSGYASLLLQELSDRWQISGATLSDNAVEIESSPKNPNFDKTVFARQTLPRAFKIPADGASPAAQQVAKALFKRIEIISNRANRSSSKWTIHSYAPDDNECAKLSAQIEKALLADIKKYLPKFFKLYASPQEMVETPLKNDAVVQIYVSSVDDIRASISSFHSSSNEEVSRYIGGNLRMRHKEGAPSRSARKIEEAYLALGLFPKIGDTAVDLGAAPGGWTFSLARRGATVTAVDAGELKLPPKKALLERVNHVKDNGLHFRPDAAVDWLVCDMIVAPHETLRVLKVWLEGNLMQHFIINLKMPKSDQWAAIRSALDLFETYKWPVMKARHLFHDRWEVTLVGTKQKI